MKSKKRFNILCIILLCSILFGTAISLSQGVRGFIDGFTAACNTPPHEVKDLSNLELLPKKGWATPTTTLKNTQNGDTIAVSMVRIIAQTKPDQASSPLGIFSISLSLLSLFLIATCIYFWIVFIKLILCVNKGRVFDRSVEKKLIRGGMSLLAIYLLEWIFTFIVYAHNLHAFEFEDYIVTLRDIPDHSLLYTSIGLMLVAQIFSIGRELKEEQELTI